MYPPRKILAIKLRSLGDTVLMTAPLAELRRAYPNSEIHALVSKPWGVLLENHPAVDKVWTYERHADPGSRLKALARTGLSLRKEGFDWVIGFHASPSSAMLAFGTGAKTRSIHFHGHAHRNRYSTVVIPGKGILKPIIERDMDTLRALGIDAPGGRLPTIHLTENEIVAAGGRIVKHGLSGSILGLGLGASRPTKTWPIERFADLATLWITTTGGSVIAFVGPGENELSQTFLKAVDDALTNQAPLTADRAKLRPRIICETALGLRELAAMLSQVAVFTGNDSGPRHLALAVGSPTVTIFGPEDPFEWHPYPEDLHPYLFVEGLPCRKDAAPGMLPWCGLHECFEERHRCMTSIGVREVLDKSLRVARVSEDMI